MRTVVTATLVLAWSLGLPLALHAQQTTSSELALSFTAGSAFDGVGMGLARSGVAGASSFGYGGGSYGIYDGGGWGSRVGAYSFGDVYGYGNGYGHRRYDRYHCADVWSILDGPYYGAVQAGFYDDWFYFSDLYYDCVLRGPSWVYHRYNAYRPFHFSYRPYRPFRTRAIYISIAIVDPFWPVWGPFYSYDPWGWYWSNSAVYGGYAPRVRTVYVTPGPIYRRPSPIYVAGTTYKEDPRGVAPAAPPRTAQPRGGASSIPGASAPANTRGDNGIQAPPRRSGPISGQLGGTGLDEGGSTRVGARGAEPRRSGDGGSAPVAPGPSGTPPRSRDPEGGRVESPAPERGGSTRQPAQRPTVGSGSAQPSTPSATNDAARVRRDATDALVQPSAGRPSDLVRGRSNTATATEAQPEPERLPTVIRLPSTSRRDPASTEPAAEPATEPRPEDPRRTTAPRVQPVPSRPSASDPQAGSRPSSRGTPAETRSGSRGQTPNTRPAPTRGQAAEEQPERRAEPAPSREAEPQPREVQPPTREVQPPSREVQPPQRQPQPQPQRQPQPQARETPSRPSSPPPAQAAPPSAGGGRPVTAPRRPGDASR